MKDSESSVESQLWHACAGGMVQMPSINSKVFYFPQGHVEHTLTTVDFGSLSYIPPLILCRVSSIKFMADPETDEVYAKLLLLPVINNELDDDDDDDVAVDADPSSHNAILAAKTLTQSDANNGGGFSVPQACAQNIFPKLDLTADPPVQTIIVKDVHGEVWNFRNIYRGSPRRYLLTTGWSNFVNQKKLVAGDMIIFLRADNGDLSVGIRRAKRGGFGGSESPSGQNSALGNNPFGLFSGFMMEESRGNEGFKKEKVSPEAVIEAVSMAVSGRQFEVVYYPQACTPEFFIKASMVRAAMKVQWYPGMRFKMPVETEENSTITKYVGTVAAVQVADPIRWPNSPWRLLRVTWDDTKMLQNVKHVSPWLVELYSSVAPISMPPKEKLQVSQPLDLFDGQFDFPSFVDNPLGPTSPMFCLPDNISVGIQGARHAQFGIPSSDPHISNKTELGNCFHLIGSDDKIAKDFFSNNRDSPQEGKSSFKTDAAENDNTPSFVLFGQRILTEQQMVSNSLKMTKSSNDESNHKKDAFTMGELGLGSGHCKVFMESENVGRTLDLSVFESYEDLFKMLANVFGFDKSDVSYHVLYEDASGVVKKTGLEPFSDFVKSARRLTITKF